MIERPQSSQLAKPLWTDPGLKSGTGVHELISTSEVQAGNESPSNLPKKSSHARQNPSSPVKMRKHLTLFITSQNEKTPHLVQLPLDTVCLELLVGVMTEHKGINGDHLTAQPTTLVPVQQSTSLLLHCTTYSSRANKKSLSRGY